MKYIDNLLNRITMYRLVVYGLGVIIALAFGMALLGQLARSPLAMTTSLTILLASCYLTDMLFSRLYNVPTNSESWLITALILFLVIAPSASLVGMLSLLLAGIIACASKFLLAWRNTHIFNPAALAAAVLSLTALLPTTWWVGSSKLWPLALLVGLAVVRKIRRVSLWLTFVAVSVVLQIIILMSSSQPMWTGLQHALLASPLIFLSTIMLTEPATMPPRRDQQLIFAALVAALYTSSWKLGPLPIYPEVALLIGNIYAFVVAPKANTQLMLQHVDWVSERVASFIFKPVTPLSFTAGQYMEWTLPTVASDGRGNRRTLTIASSPTESTVQLGVKFYEPSSAYKTALRALKPGDSIYASQVAGSFVLPADPSTKLAFIAGGIGITPFRSMLKYLVDSDQQRDVVLLYLVSDSAEIAYKDIFHQAQSHGLRVIALVGSKGLSNELVQEHIPDFAERSFMLSGPQAMVDQLKSRLREAGVARQNIRTDHFTGY